MTLTLSRKTDYTKPFDKRIHEIDFLRGFLIFLVIMDHLFYCFATYSSEWFQICHNPILQKMQGDFVYYWNSDQRAFVRYVCLFLFTFLSGISAHFVKDKWKRTWYLLLLWAALGIGSNIISNSPLGKQTGPIYIDFNVISVLAVCSFVYMISDKLSMRFNWVFVGIGILFWWFIIPSLIPQFGHIYMPFMWNPEMSGKSCADWLPLFPYFAFYFLGVLFASKFYKNNISYCKKFNFERPICFMGRHSLIIYLLGSGAVIAMGELVSAILKAVCN